MSRAGAARTLQCFWLLLCFAVLPWNATADGDCDGNQFRGAYRKGKPAPGEIGIVLLFDPSEGKLGETIFTAMASLKEENGGLHVLVSRREGDDEPTSKAKRIEFRPLGNGKKPAAAFHFTLCYPNMRPILVRVVRQASGKPLIFFEPQP